MSSATLNRRRAGRRTPDRPPAATPRNDGRDVNIASRVAARAAGGEVLVTRPVLERAKGDLEFDRIAEVRLKGFTESTEVFIARGTGSRPPLRPPR